MAVDLDWQPYFEALAYGGNFHTVGAVMKPFPVPAFTLIGGDRSISGSATGNPSELRTPDEVCRAQQSGSDHRAVPDVAD